MTEPFVVTAPGIFDIPDTAYHLDPVPGGSLSSTGARKLLPPSCPALFRHWADNPQPPRKTFDVGHAAHREVLGVGADVEVVPGEAWNTKAAKELVAAVRARGATPLKQAEYDRVQEMAAALRRHPLAGKLLEPGSGTAEQSLFWQDPETGVWCRARTDWMRNPGRGRLLVVDYKSTTSVAPDDIERAVYSYGYHVQEAFYLRGIRALGLSEQPGFLFVLQMKEPPYLVTVGETDDAAKRLGEQQVSRALAIYRDCTETGRWPGFYDDDVALISLPRWAARTEEF